MRCYKEIEISGTLSHTLDFQNNAIARRSSKQRSTDNRRRQFITLSVHLCVQHAAREAARRAGPSATVVWDKFKGQQQAPDGGTVSRATTAMLSPCLAANYSAERLRASFRTRTDPDYQFVTALARPVAGRRWAKPRTGPAVRAAGFDYFSNRIIETTNRNDTLT